MSIKRAEYCGARAHERCGTIVGQLVWNGKHEVLVPDGVACKGALVLIGKAVELAFSAEGISTLLALLAVAAAVVVVAKAGSLSDFELRYFGADVLDCAGTFVTCGYT